MLEFRNVSHAYRRFPIGRTTAVSDFSFTGNAGEVVGIAGPNGAGKSTLIALAMGFLRASAGNVAIDGQSPRRFVEANGVSYVPELVTMNKEWRADEALVRLAILNGLGSNARQRTEEVITRLGLGDHRKKKMRELSKGTAQRVGIAQALLIAHRLVVFDEPTHGLDPAWSLDFRDIVADLRSPDRLIVIASHNLDELERLADRVVILRQGRLETIVELRGAPSGIAYDLVMSAGEALVMRIFPGATETAPKTFRLPPMDTATMNARLRQVLEAGGEITELSPNRARLEQHFREPGGA
jgi:ABC-2 type transport system ATP-binding protein